MDATQIKKVRTKLGITQAEVAHIMGVHPITVIRWETGQYKPTQWQEAVLERISKTKLKGVKIKDYLKRYSVVEVLVKLFWT